MTLAGCADPFCTLTPLPPEAVVLEHEDVTPRRTEAEGESQVSTPRPACWLSNPDGSEAAFELASADDLREAVAVSGCTSEELEDSELRAVYREVVEERESRLFLLTVGGGGCITEMKLERVYESPEEGIVFDVVKGDTTQLPTPSTTCDLNRVVARWLVAVDGATAPSATLVSTGFDPEVCGQPSP